MDRLDVFFTLLLLLLPLIPWSLWRRLRGVDVRLRDAARTHRLRTHRGLVGDIAEGFVGDVGVHIRYIDTQRGPLEDMSWGPPSAICRVTLTLPAPLPIGLQLSSMSVAQTVLQGLGAQDIEIVGAPHDSRAQPEPSAAHPPARPGT